MPTTAINGHSFAIVSGLNIDTMKAKTMPMAVETIIVFAADERKTPSGFVCRVALVTSSMP
jgi:hypothetical protein